MVTILLTACQSVFRIEPGEAKQKRAFCIFPVLQRIEVLTQKIGGFVVGEERGFADEALGADFGHRCSGREITLAQVEAWLAVWLSKVAVWYFIVHGGAICFIQLTTKGCLLVITKVGAGRVPEFPHVFRSCLGCTCAPCYTGYNSRPGCDSSTRSAFLNVVSAPVKGKSKPCPLRSCSILRICRARTFFLPPQIGGL